MNVSGTVSPRDREIKRLFSRLVEAAGGNKEVVRLGIVRVHGSRISDYCSPNNTAMPPADVIADLEGFVGEPLMTRYLADLRGFHLVEQCQGERNETDALGHLAKLTREFGDVTAETLEAYRDGRCDGAEKRRIHKQAKELAEALACFMRDLEPADATSRAKLVAA